MEGVIFRLEAYNFYYIHINRYRFSFSIDNDERVSVYVYLPTLCDMLFYTVPDQLYYFELGFFFVFVFFLYTYLHELLFVLFLFSMRISSKYGVISDLRYLFGSRV